MVDNTLKNDIKKVLFDYVVVTDRVVDGKLVSSLDLAVDEVIKVLNRGVK